MVDGLRLDESNSAQIMQPKRNARPKNHRPNDRAGGKSSANVALARVLSKFGFCSRSEAVRMIQDGRVCVDGRVEENPGAWVDPQRIRISVDGEAVRPRQKYYVMLNKPRGVVTTMSDERGRSTVYDCFKDAHLPRLVPIGRLDQASEGLLLFTTDTRWVEWVAAPETHLDQIYHVQVDCVPNGLQFEKALQGVVEAGETLAAKAIRIVRQGERQCWVEIVLDEGKNRHVRRLLNQLGINVVRLIRIGLGPLELGTLAKGQFRFLTASERHAVERLFQQKNGRRIPPKNKSS